MVMLYNDIVESCCDCVPVNATEPTEKPCQYDRLAVAEDCSTCYKQNEEDDFFYKICAHKPSDCAENERLTYQDDHCCECLPANETSTHVMTTKECKDNYVHGSPKCCSYLDECIINEAVSGSTSCNACKDPMVFDGSSCILVGECPCKDQDNVLRDPFDEWQDPYDPCILNVCYEGNTEATNTSNTCEVLSCLESQQETPDGECCAICGETTDRGDTDTTTARTRRPPVPTTASTTTVATSPTETTSISTTPGCYDELKSYVPNNVTTYTTSVTSEIADLTEIQITFASDIETFLRVRMTTDGQSYTDVTTRTSLPTGTFNDTITGEEMTGAQLDLFTNEVLKIAFNPALESVRGIEVIFAETVDVASLTLHGCNPGTVSTTTTSAPETTSVSTTPGCYDELQSYVPNNVTTYTTSVTSEIADLTGIQITFASDIETFLRVRMTTDGQSYTDVTTRTSLPTGTFNDTITGEEMTGAQLDLFTNEVLKIAFNPALESVRGIEVIFAETVDVASLTLHGCNPGTVSTTTTSAPETTSVSTTPGCYDELQSYVPNNVTTYTTSVTSEIADLTGIQITFASDIETFLRVRMTTDGQSYTDVTTRTSLPIGTFIDTNTGEEMTGAQLDLFTNEVLKIAFNPALESVRGIEVIFAETVDVASLTLHGCNPGTVSTTTTSAPETTSVSTTPGCYDELQSYVPNNVTTYTTSVTSEIADLTGIQITFASDIETFLRVRMTTDGQSYTDVTTRTSLPTGTFIDTNTGEEMTGAQLDLFTNEVLKIAFNPALESVRGIEVIFAETVDVASLTLHGCNPGNYK
ncbi:galactose-specific cell agglutination protein gsf2-like [Strongylocentrotus purpuratus]|uniref:Uncharacterized protein n=1 Tax=Strongylocentrotus purpuratus TaxID=7668 RepID=A0A7M7P710_STRPU|nr:galactose-specific cell agglutination protein gsf2-like [Strongylocentrotus purpuratus]